MNGVQPGNIKNTWYYAWPKVGILIQNISPIFVIRKEKNRIRINSNKEMMDKAEEVKGEQRW